MDKKTAQRHIQKLLNLVQHDKLKINVYEAIKDILIDVTEEERPIGEMRFGCFEMQVVKKALELALKMSEIIVPTEEMRFTSEEYEAAIILLPRFTKMIEEKDC